MMQEEIESITWDNENSINYDYVNECFKRFSIPCMFVQDGYKYKLDGVNNPSHNLFYAEYNGEKIGGNLDRKRLQLVFDFNEKK